MEFGKSQNSWDLSDIQWITPKICSMFSPKIDIFFPFHSILVFKCKLNPLSEFLDLPSGVLGGCGRLIESGSVLSWTVFE